jgi:hypothetical protein
MYPSAFLFSSPPPHTHISPHPSHFFFSYFLLTVHTPPPFVSFLFILFFFSLLYNIQTLQIKEKEIKKKLNVT